MSPYYYNKLETKWFNTFSIFYFKTRYIKLFKKKKNLVFKLNIYWGYLININKY